jgi:hypothetical protein
VGCGRASSETPPALRNLTAGGQIVQAAPRRAPPSPGLGAPNKGGDAVAHPNEQVSKNPWRRAGTGRLPDDSDDPFHAEQDVVAAVLGLHKADQDVVSGPVADNLLLGGAV